MKAANKLHWSAIAGAGCTYWLLIWLFLIATSMLEISHTEGDASGLWSTVNLCSVFALWAAYRGMRRLNLLRNGAIGTAETYIETGESYDHDSGITGKVRTKWYHYHVNGESYRNTLLLSTALNGIRQLEIVYHTRKPGYSLPVSVLRTRFDRAANQWRSPMRQAIPRLILLVAFAGGILAALARGVF